MSLTCVGCGDRAQGRLPPGYLQRPFGETVNTGATVIIGVMGVALIGAVVGSLGYMIGFERGVGKR
jgi:hypothetical protein